VESLGDSEKATEQRFRAFTVNQREREMLYRAISRFASARQAA
jgi:hypothetical protein